MPGKTNAPSQLRPQAHLTHQFLKSRIGAQRIEARFDRQHHHCPIMLVVGFLQPSESGFFFSQGKMTAPGRSRTPITAKASKTMWFGFALRSWPEYFLWLDGRQLENYFRWPPGPWSGGNPPAIAGEKSRLRSLAGSERSPSYVNNPNPVLGWLSRCGIQTASLQSALGCMRPFGNTKC
jgi:hypothetical protein